MARESIPGTAPGALPWSVFESGLWMRAGVAGAGMALIAPGLVAGGEASPMVGFVAFVAGAALAVFAYRRVRRLLGMGGETSVDPRPGIGSALPRSGFPNARIRPQTGA